MPSACAIVHFWGYLAGKLASEAIIIHLGEFFPLIGHGIFFKDRFYGALRLARATVYAFFRIDVKHVAHRIIAFGPIFVRMNAVYRTYFNTRCITSVYTWLGNDICHLTFPPKGTPDSGTGITCTIFISSIYF